ncbi:hypothetical protein [Microcoleus sp. PH2017_27_LUM_O_A]|nr:hypothetical protein [Microcoleus sp. PH2017_27_LUM_O_A]
MGNWELGGAKLRDGAWGMGQTGQWGIGDINSGCAGMMLTVDC